MIKSKFDKIEIYGDQRYDKIKKSLVEQKGIFTDVVFPATTASLGPQLANATESLEWKRPKVQNFRFSYFSETLNKHFFLFLLGNLRKSPPVRKRYWQHRRSRRRTQQQLDGVRFVRSSRRQRVVLQSKLLHELRKANTLPSRRLFPDRHQLPGAGMGFRSGGKIHGIVSFPILEVRAVGRRCGGRFATHGRWETSIYSFRISQRVLGVSRGKSIREVSTLEND